MHKHLKNTDINLLWMDLSKDNIGTIVNRFLYPVAEFPC